MVLYGYYSKDFDVPVTGPEDKGTEEEEENDPDIISAEDEQAKGKKKGKAPEKKESARATRTAARTSKSTTRTEKAASDMDELQLDILDSLDNAKKSNKKRRSDKKNGPRTRKTRIIQFQERSAKPEPPHPKPETTTEAKKMLKLTTKKTLTL